MEHRNLKRIAKIQEFERNPQIKTFVQLLDMEDRSEDHKEEMKNHNQGMMSEMCSLIQESIANIPQSKDYSDRLDKIESKLDEPLEVEVVLNIK